MNDLGNVGTVRGIDFGYNGSLCLQKLFAFLRIIRGHLAVGVTVAAQHFGIANLLAFDGAVDLFLQPVCTHHIPRTAALGGVPQGLQFKEGFILQVAGFVQNNQRRINRAEVGYQVFIHVAVASVAGHAEFLGNVAYQLQLGLYLAAVHIYGVLVLFYVCLRGKGLADIGHIAQDGAQSAALAHFQLLAHKHIGRGLCCQPRHFCTQLHAQSSGYAYPVGITDLLFIIAPLNGIVHAGGYAQCRSMAVVTGIIFTVGGYRCHNTLLYFICYFHLNAVLNSF